MPSIYNQQDNEALIARIKNLKPSSTALWGKMTVDQMLKHCISPMDISFGTLQIKVPFLMRILGRFLKNRILNNKFKQNSPTAKELIFADKYDFEATQAEIIEKCKRFQNGSQVIKEKNHAFWGEMSEVDWDKLQWKHLDHHLRQFGV